MSATKLTRAQRKKHTFTVTMTGLQIEALSAFADISEPEPCFDHEDGQHGDFSECMGYAPEFEAAVWEAFDAIFRASR